MGLVSFCYVCTLPRTRRCRIFDRSPARLDCTVVLQAMIINCAPISVNSLTEISVVRCTLTSLWPRVRTSIQHNNSPRVIEVFLHDRAQREVVSAPRRGSPNRVQTPLFSGLWGSRSHSSRHAAVIHQGTIDQCQHANAVECSRAPPRLGTRILEGCVNARTALTTRMPLVAKTSAPVPHRFL